MEVMKLAERGLRFDTSRLTEDELEVWKGYCEPKDRPLTVFDVWSFMCVSMLELGQVSDVVVEFLDEHDPDDMIGQYIRNHQAALRRGEIKLHPVEGDEQ
jgi:hypothetical protein